MKKNLLVILLTMFAAGTMTADEGGGFFAHIGEGVKDIIESPAHIGQGGKKSKKELKEEQKKKNLEQKQSKDQEPKRRRARRRQKSEYSE